MARKPEAENLLRQGLLPSQMAQRMGISTSSVVEYLRSGVGEGALRFSQIYFSWSASIRSGQPYQTRLDPPPGPPAAALPKWLPGKPRPADWPSHIHGPRDVYDRAKANGIGWRSLLIASNAEWAGKETMP